jgi:histidinol-phosphate phosphatase family protein
LTPPAFDIVIPTAGRPQLAALLAALGGCEGPRPGRVLVVDDRAERSRPLDVGTPAPWVAARLSLLEGRAAGPAAARNIGWRASDAEWIAFCDDDVLPPSGWLEQLGGDLARASAAVGAVQGRVRVPLPHARRPTDWERNTAGLEDARWATADMAYRRIALASVDGFDERFPRAYREDADLGLRVTQAGWRIVKGQREVLHPVRRPRRMASVRAQMQNADDALMLVKHGRGWRRRAGVPRGRRPLHMATTAAGVLATVAAATGRRRLAAAAGSTWAAATTELAWRRIAPGPRTPAEVAAMAGSSLLLPPFATAAWLAGLAHAVRAVRGVRPPAAPAAARPGAGSGAATPEKPAAVLFDRDGTLVVDFPYNGDPTLVFPMPGARQALARLRSAGVPSAVVTNQSAVGRGMISAGDLAAVNRRVEELLGPLGPWAICTHAPEDHCACRKPRPGLIVEAARALGVRPDRCAVIGDIGADVEAARAAGARAILVPTATTLPGEVAAAPEVAPDLPQAVELLLGEAP